MSEPDTRGILTDADKSWLHGEADYEHVQSEANRKEAIRERVALAMQDFDLLIQNWSAKERQKTMEEIDMEACAERMIEFLYIALNETALDAEEMIDKGPNEKGLAFHRALCRGIRKGKSHFGDAPDKVLINMNTESWELPSEEDVQNAIDIEEWRASNKFYRSAVNTEDDAVTDKEKAARHYRMALGTRIENELIERRHQSDTEITGHHGPIGSMGLLDGTWSDVDE